MEYRFDSFRLDPRSSSLYFEDKLVEGLSKKSVQILAVLVEKPKQVISHEDIISRVWGENYAGADSRSVAQYVLKIRKTFSEKYPDENFISTAPNRGYAFDRDVTVIPLTNGLNGGYRDEINLDRLPPATDAIVDERQGAVQSRPRIRRWWLIPVGLVLVVVMAAASYLSTPEEDRVRKVVKDSQLYESLVLYRDPKSFSEGNLDKYWTTEIDVNSNFDRKRIREGVRGLVEKGQYYGSETKCEQFEFQSVEIDIKNEMAIVKTLEKWFISVYREDGSLEKNKNVGPYFVSYVLRNIDGRWLIEKSSTARVNLPTPHLDAIEPLTEIRSGQQYFVKASGQAFVPASVYLRVSGEGCPEQNPCIVPNSALLKHAKLSETSLDNVPLTLDSGDFQIFIHNSETHFSNPVNLTIP